MTHEPLPWRNLMRPDLEANPAEWKGHEVRALSGIGYPQRFFDMVASLGIARQPTTPFPTTMPTSADDVSVPRRLCDPDDAEGSR